MRTKPIEKKEEKKDDDPDKLVFTEHDSVDFAVNQNGFKVINQLLNYPNFKKIELLVPKCLEDKTYPNPEDKDLVKDIQKCCYLCDKERGVKVGCDFGNCPVVFHYTCGIAQGVINSYYQEHVFCTIHLKNAQETFGGYHASN